MEHLRHRGAGDIGPLAREAALGKVSSGMLAVRHVDIGDDVHYAAVRLLRKALILTSVPRLHVEDGDVKPFGPDDAEAGVGVAKNEDGVRPGRGEQFVAAVDYVAACGAEVITDGVHVDLWCI